MQSFDEILSYIDRICKYLSNRWLEYLFPYQKSISATLNLFSDDESKEEYCREIAYCIFTNFLKDDLPSTLAGLMSNRDWKNWQSKIPTVHPELKAPHGAQWLLDYCRTATFILEQYIASSD